MADQISIISEFKYPSDNGKQVIQFLLVENFSCSLYSGKILIVAVDGNGLYLYSLPHFQCIKSILTESAISFLTLPFYDSSDNSLFIAVGRAENQNCIAKYSFLTNELHFSCCELPSTVAINLISKTGPLNEILVFTKDQRVFHFSRNLDLLSEHSVEDSLFEQIRLCPNGKNSFHQNCLQCAKTNMSIDSFSTFGSFNDLFVGVHNETNETVFIDYNQKLLSEFSNSFSSPVSFIKPLSSSYFCLVEGEMLSIYDTQMSVLCYQSSFPILSASKIQDAILLGDNILCLGFQNSFGTIELPIELDSFSLERIFGLKQENKPFSFNSVDISNLTNETVNRLISNLDKLPHSFLRDNLAQLIASKEITSWSHPHFLDFLLTKEDPVIVKSFLINSNCLKESDLIKVLLWNRKTDDLVSVVFKQFFSKDMMLSEIHKLSFPEALKLFHISYELFREQKTSGIHIEFLSCLIECHFVSFVLSSTDSIYEKLKEISTFIKNFQIQNRQLLAMNGYLDGIKRDLKSCSKTTFIADYSVEHIKF